MSWTAVIPLRGSGERKTRLATRLDEGLRHRLSQRLFGHVSAVLESCPQLSDVLLLSDRPPDYWGGRTIADKGRGLNAELGSLLEARPFGPLLVIHADLPLVSAEDIRILLDRAEEECAIAPDRHGRGTNAIALRDPAGFAFAFGPDSFTRHLAAASGRAQVVARPGLALDIDTPADLDAALAAGFALE